MKSSPSSVSFETTTPTGLLGLFGLFIVAGAVVSLKAFITRGNYQSLWSTFYYAVLGIWFVLICLYGSRPVIEIAEHHLRYRTCLRFWFSAVAFRDVFEIGEVSRFWRRLRLVLRSGKAVHIYLNELKPPDREEVVLLIRERVGREQRDA